MVENDSTTTDIQTGATAPAEDAPAPPRRRRGASRPAGPPAAAPADETAVTTDGAASTAAVEVAATSTTAADAVAEEPAADAAPARRARAPRKTAAKRTTKKAAAPDAAPEVAPAEGSAAEASAGASSPLDADLPGHAEPAAPVAAADAPTESIPDAADADVSTPAPAARSRRTRKTAAKRAAPSEAPAAEVEEEPTPEPDAPVPAVAVATAPALAEPPLAEPLVPPVLFQAPVVDEPAVAPRRRRRATRPVGEAGADVAVDTEAVAELDAVQLPPAIPTFGAPEPVAEDAPRTRPARRRRATRSESAAADVELVIDPAAEQAVAAAELLVDRLGEGETAEEPVAEVDDEDNGLDAGESEEIEPDNETDGEDGDESRGDTSRRRRRRGGRGRRSRGRTDAVDGDADAETVEPVEGEDAEIDAAGTAGTADTETDGDDESTGSRRRRRRRRRGGEDGEAVVEEVERPSGRSRDRRPRTRDDGDEVQSLRGSTRLEAKKQRRREGRELGRRRTPLLTEAEFLARREAVERTMVVRRTGKRTQIAVLEDDMLVEHYIDNGETVSLVGSVFLGRVQNVLPSMEAAFLDLGHGRNAVLYAGEVNWDAAGMEGQPKRIELALKSGDPVLVQVTKDPIGHKGARLTSQVSLPGRFLVYVPGGSMTGISRKLPENERTRLKSILRRVVPEDAGVIVRTAAEGASEEDIAADVERLQEQWEQIQQAASTAAAPALLHGEPDLTVRVLRDVFNEDFRSVVVSGDAAWDTVEPYIRSVAPELADRVQKWTGNGDVFAAHRIDEQLAKALDRKVFLPSGGSLVIDRTEAMVVVDVNTGRFTGKGGGNLEETVTKNNIEAAEEIVRQLRLRDMGGIIVIDFIDMVLESNRDLVMRRLLECLGRDRTKHQVAEVTSLGLVQMTRKRVGTGLLEAFSEPCEHCKGRGVILHMDAAVEHAANPPEPRRQRALVTPGAPPSPALLAPPSARPAGVPAVASADSAPEGAAQPEPVSAETLAGDAAAVEDPVAGVEAPSSDAPSSDASVESTPAEAVPAAEPVADESAALLPGPDPVSDVVDDGRPQRRRRRATRP